MAWLVARIWAVLMQSCSEVIWGSLVVQAAVDVVLVPSGVEACTVKIHVVFWFSLILCFSKVLYVSW